MRHWQTCIHVLSSSFAAPTYWKHSDFEVFMQRSQRNANFGGICFHTHMVVFHKKLFYLQTYQTDGARLWHFQFVTQYLGLFEKSHSWMYICHINDTIILHNWRKWMAVCHSLQCTVDVTILNTKNI